MRDEQNRDFYYNANKTDFAAAATALFITVFFHLGIFYALPDEFSHAKPDEKQEELQIEILPPKIENRKPEFIEANPFGNNDKPLNPNAPESFKDQRAADELPDPASKSKRPYVEGETKDSQKIVSGTSSETDNLSPNQVLQTLERPLEQPAQPTETPSQKQAQTPPQNRQPQQPTQTPDKTEGADAAAAEKSASKDSANNKSEADKNSAPQKDEQRREETTENENAFLRISPKEKNAGDTDAETGKTAEKKSAKESKGDAEKETQDSGGGKPSDTHAEQPSEPQQPQPAKQPEQERPQQQEQLPAPKPRPMLSMRIPAGPLADNRVHASTRGTVACDSKFSEFGAYQQRMLEAISRQWNLLASKYDLGTAVGTAVVIEFYLNSSGELSKFNILFSSSTNTGSGLCEQSILTTAPYGEWTQEMVNTFGNQDQSVRITFHYR